MDIYVIMRDYFSLASKNFVEFGPNRATARARVQKILFFFNFLFTGVRFDSRPRLIGLTAEKVKVSVMN